MNFKEFLNEGRVLGFPPGTYIIIYRDEKKYVKYGSYPNNNVAVRQTWTDGIYYGTLHEEYDNMRIIKGFTEISLKDAQKIEKDMLKKRD